MLIQVKTFMLIGSFMRTSSRAISSCALISPILVADHRCNSRTRFLTPEHLVEANHGITKRCRPLPCLGNQFVVVIEFGPEQLKVEPGFRHLAHVGL
jgi:hypothetical protein